MPKRQEVQKLPRATIPPPLALPLQRNGVDLVRFVFLERQLVFPRCWNSICRSFSWMLCSEAASIISAPGRYSPKAICSVEAERGTWLARWPNLSVEPSAATSRRPCQRGTKPLTSACCTSRIERGYGGRGQLGAGAEKSTLGDMARQLRALFEMGEEFIEFGLDALAHAAEQYGDQGVQG